MHQKKKLLKSKKIRTSMDLFKSYLLKMLQNQNLRFFGKVEILKHSIIFTYEQKTFELQKIHFFITIHYCKKFSKKILILTFPNCT